jgi:hypothetical protein
MIQVPPGGLCQSCAVLCHMCCDMTDDSNPVLVYSSSRLVDDVVWRCAGW